MSVKVQCIKVYGKLRVRPLPGQGYDQHYNIQFPKDKRKSGQTYLVDGLINAGGFYRLSTNFIATIPKKERKVKTNTPKFKMRNPPTKLTRDTITIEVEIGKEYSMGNVAKMIAGEIATRFPGKEYSKLNLDYLTKHLDQVNVEATKGPRYYSPTKTYASFSFDESEVDFKARLERFATPLAEYNSWRKANAELIKEHEARIEAKTKEAALKKKAALDKKMLMLQSKLNRLQAKAA